MACQRLMQDIRTQWTTVGAVELPGFIRESVRAQLAAEVAPSAGLLSHHRLYAKPYLGAPVFGNLTDLDTDPRHPLRRQHQTDIHAVAADQVSRGTLLRRLYDSPQVAAFFARLVETPELHQYADEFQKLNVMYQFDGGARNWHYDGSDFVATLMVQQGDEGGEFEFAPFIRGEMNEDGRYDERYDAVRALFDGSYEGRRLKTRAETGSLQLFNGCRSLHRVRSVYGPTTRITAVLSYDTRPACEQPAPSLAANLRNYGPRLTDSPLWELSQAERQKACAGLASPPPFETE